jgi:hypothetical protein
MTITSIEDLARKLRGTEVPADCPECRSAGSVRGGLCEICFAELDEAPPPPERRPLGEAPPHPREGTDEAAGAPAASSPLRFADVIAELQAIAALARDLPGAEGPALASACRRAEGLLTSLRRQFIADVAL